MYKYKVELKGENNLMCRTIYVKPRDKLHALTSAVDVSRQLYAPSTCDSGRQDPDNHLDRRVCVPWSWSELGGEE
jgi:hypothetical protein